ncbi:helix-turn-helix domain-containing protein [Actinomadura scrupuli]|uniref:helix-turn-helix domain-containing protein n=1 Tax=Actinomadura scrupuli TaxID=559629 RepID=UPI003D97E7D6
MARPPKPLDPASSGLALFGSTLRMYREAAGETLAVLGGRINYSASTIGETERGESRCERLLAERADTALGTGGALAHLWDYLVKRAVYPTWFDWPGHEARATTFRSFELSVIGGLLQHEDYARVLLRGDEAAVQARLARQEVLARKDPALLVAVIDESVLHREIGSPEVMRGQLEHLIAVASDSVSIQVVPSGFHRGISGSFVIATLADRSEVAYVDTAARGITMSDPQDLDTLTRSFEAIRSQALPVSQSLDVIRRTAEQRWT